MSSDSDGEAQQTSDDEFVSIPLTWGSTFSPGFPALCAQINI